MRSESPSIRCTMRCWRTRGFTHLMLDGDDAEAARWAERGARSPGAHVL